MSPHLRVLMIALLLLAALFGWGFHDRPAALIFSAGPPLMLAIGLGIGVRSATFWAGVFALGWFSYGVMEAWTLRGSARAFALAIIALALVIVGTASWGGMKARFGKPIGKQKGSA